MWKSRSISVSILYRKSVGKPISDVDQQKFDAWYNESEKHRLYYKRFCVHLGKYLIPYSIILYIVGLSSPTEVPPIE